MLHGRRLPIFRQLLELLGTDGLPEPGSLADEHFQLILHGLKPFLSNKRLQFRQTASLRPLQGLVSLWSRPSVQNLIDLPRTRLNPPVRHETHSSSRKWCRLFLVGSERVDDLLRHWTSQFVKDYLA